MHLFEVNCKCLFSTVDLGVNCWLVVPEVSLLDRLVPSTGEKEQSEALSFLNFWEEKSVFLYFLYF